MTVLVCAGSSCLTHELRDKMEADKYGHESKEKQFKIPSSISKIKR